MHLSRLVRFSLFSLLFSAFCPQAGAAISTAFPRTEAVSEKQVSKKEKRVKKKLLRQWANEKKGNSKYGSWAIMALFVGLLIGGITQSISISFLGLGVAALLTIMGFFKDENKLGAIAATTFTVLLLTLLVAIRIAIKNSDD